MIFEDIVFIHIPKTAGSSIQNSLIKKNKIIYEGSRSFYEHISSDENMTLHKSKIKAKSFRRHLPLELIKLSKFHISKPVITFIRNPFSRAVSLYYECIRSEFYRTELKLNEQSVSVMHRRDHTLPYEPEPTPHGHTHTAPKIVTCDAEGLLATTN